MHSGGAILTRMPGSRAMNGGEGNNPSDPALVKSYSTTSYAPAVPRKFILEDHSLVEVFRKSASFQKVISYLQGCSEAIGSTPLSMRMVKDTKECCPAVRYLLDEFFPFLHQLITDIPLEDLAQQRFGNRAKRVFHTRLDEVVVPMMEKLVRTLPEKKELSPYSYSAATHVANTSRSEADVHALAGELAEYVKDSFGNPVRLDYGSGHELHFFLVIMICLEEHGDYGGTLHDEPSQFVPLTVPPPAPVPRELRPRVKQLRQDYIFHVFMAYMALMRRIQTHYSLEPAGSHGVWGLDDYHHIPYVLGAAQLINAEIVSPLNGDKHREALVLTKDICDKEKVAQWKDEYLYFSMIAWILANKKGPFHEHSNMLYNISAVEHWAKVYSGMVKMFAGEVLAKFNVSQHLLFGAHLPWNTTTLPTP